MAINGAAFQIGRSALEAYQSAIAIAGQNIANVGNPDYARQTGRLRALLGGPTITGVEPGAGVGLSSLQRHVDESVESRLRLALAGRSGAEATFSTLNSVEGLYNELGEQNLSTLLSELFGSFGGMQTDPTDLTSRDLVISAADGVIRTMQRHRQGLLDEVEQINNAADATTSRANAIVSEIARLNDLIVTAQARGNGGDSALKDRRDGLLRELAETMDIQVRHQANGSLNLYVGSEPLVEFNRSRGLKTERELVDGIEISRVRFINNNGPVTLRDGRLGRMVEARDVTLRDQLHQLDDLARGLVYEVNRVHSQGQGLVGWSSVTGSFAVRDPNAALNSANAGLSYPVQNGTLMVLVRDTATGQVTTRQIEIDLDGIGTDTSLSGLAARLSTVPGLTANVTTDGRLSLQTAPGQEVSFAEDSSGALAALGVGTFFEGIDAATIAVSTPIRDDPRRIAAALTGAPGDGDNAGNLARIGVAGSGLLSGRSISDFRTRMVNDLAIATASAKANFEAADSVHASLLAQRESISGVSLDEEAINLTKYEKAFQGASRYLNVIDQLGDEVLALVGV